MQIFFCPQQLHEFQLCENCFINECEMISVSKELLRITGPSQGLKIRGGGLVVLWGAESALLVEIGLTVRAKTGGAEAPPSPPAYNSPATYHIVNILTYSLTD